MFKYKYENLAKASATSLMVALAASSWGAPLVVGVQGKVIFELFKLLSMLFASIGVVLLNVGVANVEVWLEKGTFDGTMEDVLDYIKAKGGKNKLTEQEKKELNAKIIAAHNKFGTFGDGLPNSQK